jgi:hypothetical protein
MSETDWIGSTHGETAPRITDSSPPALSFKDDNAAKRIGLSPPDNVFSKIEKK